MSENKGKKWYDGITLSENFSDKNCKDKKSLNRIKIFKVLTIIFAVLAISFPFTIFGMISAIDCKIQYTYDLDPNNLPELPDIPDESFANGINLETFQITYGDSSNISVAIYEMHLNMVLLSTSFFNTYLKDNFTNTFRFYTALVFGGTTNQNALNIILGENMTRDFLSDLVILNQVFWLDISQNPYIKTPVGSKVLFYKDVDIGTGSFSQLSTIPFGWYGFLDDPSLADTNRGKFDFQEDEMIINTTLTTLFWEQVYNGFSGGEIDFDVFLTPPFYLTGDIVKTNWWEARDEIFTPINPN